MSCSVAAFSVISDNDDIYNNGKQYLVDAFLPSLIVTAIVLAIFYAVKKLSSRFPYAKLQRAAAAVIAGVTVCEVYPYSFFCVESELGSDYNDAFNIVAENVGNYKVWDAYPENDGNHKSILTDHRLVDHGISSVNAYTSLNNPDLFRYVSGGKGEYSSNGSGLLIGSSNSKDMIKYQNNFMSMMGIKYIIDNYGIIENDICNSSLGNSVINTDKGLIPLSENGLGVLAIPIELEPYSHYAVSFKTDKHIGEDIVMDLFAENYDSTEQELLISDFGSEDSYSFEIFSGNTSSVEGQAYLRFFTYNSFEIKEPVEIYDLKAEKNNTAYQENAYVPFYITEDYKIYENVNAKDVLYIPQSVEGVDDKEFIFDNMLTLDLANVSYVEGAESSTAAPAHISNIDFGNDRITADINAEGDTFVNFSQCRFTGWRAFVDGCEVPVYEVNGLIMGAYVPQGEHVIEFRFTAPYLIAAYILSGSALVFWIAYFAVSKNNSNTKSDQQKT